MKNEEISEQLYKINKKLSEHIDKIYPELSEQITKKITGLQEPEDYLPQYTEIENSSAYFDDEDVKYVQNNMIEINDMYGLPIVIVGKGYEDIIIRQILKKDLEELEAKALKGEEVTLTLKQEEYLKTWDKTYDKELFRKFEHRNPINKKNKGIT